jgi:hypothetical protein
MVDRAGLVFPDFGGECSACAMLVLARRYRSGLNRAKAEGEKASPAEAARPSEV